MTEPSRHEREVRAFEALIVSQFRYGRGGTASPEEVPELTDKDRAALNALGPDLIGRLLAGAAEDPGAVQLGEGETADVADLAFAGSAELIHGLNRADEIDPDTQAELELRREELRERLRKRRAADKTDGA